MGNGAAQAKGGEMVLNHNFAAPTSIAAGQVGLAVAGGIKQLGFADAVFIKIGM